MKTVLSTLLILFFLQSSIGQCERKGTFEGGPMEETYPISGDAKIKFETNGSKKIIFADEPSETFATVQGFDLKIFLSKNPNIDPDGDPENDLQITGTLEVSPGVMGEPMDPFTGRREYDIPANVELNDYNYIIIQCTQFNVLWGNVLLGDTIGADCNTLSTDIFTSEELSIFPNPVNDQLNIQLKSLDAASFKIFGLNGQLVQTVAQTNTTNSQIDMSNLETGLYLLEITSKNKTGYYRLAVN